MSNKVTFRKHFKDVWSVALLFFILNAGSASCQLTSSLISLKQSVSSLHDHYAGNEHTIAVFPNGALSYYEYNDVYSTPALLKGNFVYNYNASTIKSFDLPTGVYATDFRQYTGSDLIVFCGFKRSLRGDKDDRDSYTETGIVGWFDIGTTILHNSIDVYMVEIPEICRFDKIESYFNDPNIGIAAIGRLQSDIHKYAIFNLDRVQFDTNATYNCNLYPVRYGESLNDIVRTHNYIVFVGQDANAGGLCIRREYFNQMGTPNELNNIYAFPFADDKYLQSVHATYLGNKEIRSDDNIAINTINLFSSNDVHSLYRFINVATLTMTGAQEFKMFDKIDSKGIAYSHNPKFLCTLLTNDPVTAGTYSSVVLINPFATTTYTANYIYNPNDGYSAIGCLNYDVVNGDHFLLGGPILWYLKKTSHPTSAYPNDCNSTGHINVYTIQTVRYKSDIDFLSNSMIKTCIMMPCIVYDVNASIYCNELF